MNSDKLVAAVKLIRPLNVGIIIIVIAAAAVLSGGTGVGMMPVILAAVAGGLIGGGANTINDYFDVAIDRVNKPKRPLARGDLSTRSALIIWFVCTFAGISLNLFLNSSAFWIAVSAAIALFFYSAWLKGTVLLGNLLVAAMTGLALIYGGVAAGFPERAYLPAMFAFLINFGREILKDVEDMEGDRAGRAVTFPIRFGPAKALGLATAVFLVLMGATVVPYTIGMYGNYYLVLVSVVNLVMCFVMISMWTNRSRANLGKLNTLLKAAMLIGLTAIYAGMKTL